MVGWVGWLVGWVWLAGWLVGLAGWLVGLAGWPPSSLPKSPNPQAIPPEPTQSKAGFHQHLYVEFTETTPTCLTQTGGSSSVNLIQALNRFFNGFLKDFRGFLRGSRHCKHHSKHFHAGVSGCFSTGFPGGSRGVQGFPDTAEPNLHVPNIGKTLVLHFSSGVSSATASY